MENELYAGFEYTGENRVRLDVKTTLLRVLAAVIAAASLSNCTTAYDAYGRPQQVVTPEGAVLGAAAVGLLAYGLADSNNHRRYDRYDGYGRHRYAHGYSRAPYGYSYRHH